MTARMLLLAPLAEAHLPHDDVVTVALRTDDGVHLVAALQASGTQRAGPWALLRWDGAGWDPLASPPTRDQPVGLAWSGEAVLLLDSGGQIWTGPAPWAASAGPTGTDFRGLRVVGGTLYVAADTGVWARPLAGGDWALETTTEMTWVGGDSAHIAGTGADGSLWLDGATLPPLAGAVAITADGAYAATATDVYRNADSWVPCAGLPVSDADPAEQAEIVALAGDGGTLVVGTGQWVYRSTDGCSSWVEEEQFPDGASYGTAAGAIDAATDACTGVWLQDGVAVVSGHRGVAVHDGSGWQAARLLDATWLRDVTHDGTGWFAATYGAAVVEDSTDTLTQLGVTLDHAAQFGRYVDRIGEHSLLYCGDIEAYWSDDGGASFAMVALPFVDVGVTAVAGGAGWAFQPASKGNGVARTTDGVTWASISIPSGPVRELRDAVLDNEIVILARAINPDTIWVSRDGGDTWATLVDDGDDAKALVTWPADEGRRLIRAGDVIRLSDDGGLSWREATTGPTMPDKLAVDGDHLYAADAGGFAWASDDGGETWTEGGWIGAVVAELVVVDGAAHAATLRGLMASADAGQTWAALPAIDALPLHNADLQCVSVSGTGCRRGTQLELDPLDELSVWTRASTLRFVGTGRLEVSADGVALGEVTNGAAIDLTGAGWQHIRAVATSAGAIDQVVGLVGGSRPTPDEPASPAWQLAGTPDAGPVPPPPCGCASPPRNGLSFLGFLALLGRRR